jgi:type IV pilus assembly protein PilM
MLALRLEDIATRHIRVPADKLEQAGDIIARQVTDQANGQELSICPIPVVDLFDKGEMKREFLCCIASAQAIQEVIDVTEALGLVPDGIDIEPCAQARPFLLRPGHDTVLYLDVGLRSSRITVVRGGSALTMRTVKVGSEHLDALVRRHLQTDLETLCTFGGEAAQRPELAAAVSEAVAQPLAGILQRIAASTRYCAALFQGRAATLIRVCGGAAALPGLVPYIQRRLGIETELADPFDGVDTSAVPALGCREHPAFATAMGLALREADL